MFAKILLVLFYLLAPAGVLWATRKFEVFRRLGPVLSLYILGVVVANVGIFPSDPEAHKSFLAFQESVSPMMLFGCNFKNFSVGKSLSAFVVGVLSVAAIVVASYVMFADKLGAEAPKMAASLVGQYTGGAANLASVKQMVGLSTENFVMLSTCNLIVSFFYLMFLMGGGVGRIARGDGYLSGRGHGCRWRIGNLDGGAHPHNYHSVAADDLVEEGAQLG